MNGNPNALTSDTLGFISEQSVFYEGATLQGQKRVNNIRLKTASTSVEAVL